MSVKGRVYSVVSVVAVRQIVSAKFGGNEIIIYLCGVKKLFIL